MKLNIYIQRNKILQCTGQPIFVDREPDVFSKQTERSLLTESAEKVVQFENVDIYHIGVYDDESMELKAINPAVKILDCGLVLEDRKLKEEILAQARLLKKGKEKDGKSSK